MAAIRLLARSVGLAAGLSIVALPAAAQPEASVQQLLERGALQEAVQKAEAERENPESTYLAAQALIKMNDPGRATGEFGRLRESPDEAWKAIGESGAELAAGNVDPAMAAAARAIEVNGDHPYAHYQLGLVAMRQNDFQRAAQAFGRAVELKPDFAYAHYHAGVANQKLKEIAKMSEHFELFLHLAPKAPERAAVAAILRALRR